MFLTTNGIVFILCSVKVARLVNACMAHFDRHLHQLFQFWHGFYGVKVLAYVLVKGEMG